MGTFDPGYILKALSELLPIVPQVLLILLLAAVFGMMIGLLFAVVRIRQIPVLQRIIGFLISFLRGTPQVVQLFIVYYGIPQIFAELGYPIPTSDQMVFVVVTFSLNSAANFAEAFRASYLAVDPGQLEAARSIGLSGWQYFRKVLFPQAFRVALPNLGNLLIRLLQATSLSFTIGMVDLMGRAKIIDSWTNGVKRLEIYLAVSFLYWGICLLIELIVHRAEKSFSFGHAGLSGSWR